MGRPNVPGMYNPNAPRPVEVFHLSDSANAAIPADIRSQFHTDDRGHVLFFSSAPLDIAPSNQQNLGHSLKYLAAKEERREKVEDRKRKQAYEQEEQDKAAKRARVDEESNLASRVEALAGRAVQATADQIMAGTDQFYQKLYGDNADNAKQSNATAREQMNAGDLASRAETARIQARSASPGSVNLRGWSMFMGDAPSRS